MTLDIHLERSYQGHETAMTIKQELKEMRNVAIFTFYDLISLKISNMKIFSKDEI